MKEMKDLKKRKKDEAGSSNLVSKEELRLLIVSLDKPALVDLLYKPCVSISFSYSF
jgi:hypothetical protein